MHDNPKHKVGDWISWWNGHQLVIAEVRYIEKPKTFSATVRYVTNSGICDEDEIREVRSASK
jgi:hypothetical protein